MPPPRDRPNDEIDCHEITLEPTLHGHHICWQYSDRFWLPILGPVAWATWQTLISFCYAKRDTCWPSLSLLADIAANGNRNVIKGRWEQNPRHRFRRKGAIELLEEHGLIIVEPRGGTDRRYTFHVLKEPPLLTPDQVRSLPPRLQTMHAALLHKCGIDPQTHAARATRPPTPQDPPQDYALLRRMEDTWRKILAHCQRRLTPANYDLYLSRTAPIYYDPNSHTLTVEAPNPMVAISLQHQFSSYVARAAAETDATVDGSPIDDVIYTARRLTT